MQENITIINSKDSFFKNLSIFCFLLFPASIVAGPFFAELFMNIISLAFLYNVIKKKNFFLFKQKFFIIFILFYFYILLISFFSTYAENIFYKNFFYFRYIIFVYAISELLLNNKNLVLLFYKFLLFTIFIVGVDGCIQYLFSTNLIGYTQIREDRISGIFGEKLVLGSYMARLFPLFVGLFLYNFKLLKSLEIYLSFITIIFCVVTILISGERMALGVTIMYIVLAFVLFDLKIKLKVISLSLITSLILLIYFLSPIVSKRLYNQTVSQVNLKLDNEFFFDNFYSYSEIYKTAFKGFLDQKIIGQGPGSFRFFCADQKFLTIKKNQHNFSLKDFGFEKVQIDKIFINNNNNISLKKGDILFSYHEDGKIKYYTAEEDFYIISTNISKNIDGKIVEDPSIYFVLLETYRNGCNTHPHNFYLQLLSETGIIGFLFVFLIFLYVVYLIFKYLYFYIFVKRKILSNLKISLALGFLTTLLPIIPNGNFFNNWLNMIMFFPVGFYIFSLNKKKRNE